MREHIVKLLEKYEDEIMENTLGKSIDEYGERYADVYRLEWQGHKKEIACILDKIIKSGVQLSSIGMAYIITLEWSGVMTFSEGDLKMDELQEVSNKIINELNIC